MQHSHDENEVIAWVHMGGTGEYPFEDQKNLNETLKEYHILKKQKLELENKIRELKSSIEQEELNKKDTEITVKNPEKLKFKSLEDAFNETNRNTSTTNLFSNSNYWELGTLEAEYEKVTKLYDEKYNDFKTTYEHYQQFGDSYAGYAPPVDIFLSRNSQIELIPGVRAALYGQKQTEFLEKKKYYKAAKQLIKDTYDHITASSEKKRINEYMQKLKEMDKKPDRIVLTGFSRGGSGAIELARAIYLEYGDTIKIDMNIHDPVPGPMRHVKSKKAIPPNVESLVITYAGNESSRLFKPQNIHKIFYDKSKTAVTAIILPMKHVEETNKSYGWNKIKDIHQTLWDTLTKSRIDEPKKLSSTYTGIGYSNQITSSPSPEDPNQDPITKNIGISSNRKNRIQFKAPDLPGVDSRITKFHELLTGKIRTEKKVKEIAVSPGTQNPLTRDERNAELDRIYAEGRRELENTTLALRSSLFK